MQSARDTKTSFFDQDKQKFDFELFRQGSKHLQDVSSLPMIISPLNCKETGTNNLKKGIFGLHNRLLVYHGNKVSNSPKAVLDLNHSRLKIVISSSRDAPSGQTLVLTRNNTSFDLHFPDKETTEKWKAALKRICVLTTFHDDYVAIKQIGKGSFASVYLVESKSDGVAYAAKGFTKQQIDTPSSSRFKLMLLNEIEMMRAMKHENIIKLYEIHETEKSIYLIMELIQGRSLEDVLGKQREILEEKAKEIIQSILDVAAYLAAKGIMHRDLKPGNILIERGGKVKVVDFGLATYIDAEDYIFKKCGTPGFIAPEVFKFKQKTSPGAYNDRCDVFSTGCLLFHLLFGYPLFNDTNINTILQLNKEFTDNKITSMVQKEVADPTSKINKDGLSLLLKLLECDPKKRISANDALNHHYFKPAPSLKIKLPNSKEESNWADGFLSPRSIVPSLESRKLKNTRGELSPNLFKKDRYTEKDSFCYDVGNSELNGKVNTLSRGSIGSIGNSVILKSSSIPSAPTSPSNFAKSKAMSLKSKVYSQSFKITTPDNRKTVLKAAIFRNIKLHNGIETQNDGERKEGRFSEALFDRRHSEDFIPRSRDSRDWSESPSPNNLSGEVGSDGEENCQVQMNAEKFARAITRKHSSKILKSPGRFTEFVVKSAR